MHYQWYDDTNEEMTDETEKTLQLSNVVRSGRYECYVRDDYGNSEWVSFYVTVDSGLVTPPGGTIAVAAGSAVSLDATSTTVHGSGLTYEWAITGIDMAIELKETSSILSTGNIEPVYPDALEYVDFTDSVRYTCTVSDGCNSKAVTFIVVPQEKLAGMAYDFDHAQPLTAGAENTAVIGYSEGEHYFAFTPDKSGLWTISSSAEADTWINSYLYDSDKNLLRRAESEERGQPFSLQYELQAGKTYYIAVSYLMLDRTGSFSVFAAYEGEAEHTWNDGTVTKQPTCTEAGERTYTCTGCGQTRTETIPEAEHQYGEEKEVPATADTNGKKYQSCGVCGAEKILEIIPATGTQEKITAAEEAMDALTGDKGTVTDETVSKALETVTAIDNQTMIDMVQAENGNSSAIDLVTNLEKTLVESTEGFAAKITDTTVAEGEGTVAGVSVEGAAVTAAAVISTKELTDGATYQAQLAVTENADESTAGVYSVDISLNILQVTSGSPTTIETNVQPAAPIRITLPVPDNFWNSQFVLKHNDIEVISYVRNENQTISFYAASLSPWSLEITRCAADAHDYQDVDDASNAAATCGAAGSQMKKCTICGDPMTVTTPATGNHTMITVTEMAATCGTAGSQHTECSVCGLKEASTAIPATGNHTMITKTDKAATCGAAGSQHTECSVCGLKEASTVIPATGNHTMITKTDKAATCGANGSQHTECSVCGYRDAAVTTIPATGNHTYSAWSVTQPPTALAAGVQTRRCSVCGKTETASVAKLTPTIKVSAASIPLKVKQSTTKLKVSGLAAGDYVKSWKSSNTKIVKVSSSGKLTAQNKTGKANITITLASGLTKTVKVTVKKTAVKTTKISGLSKKLTLAKGKKTTLSPVLTPITTTDKVTYSTSNKKVAAVSGKGVITAKASGKAKITVKSGSKKFVVTVTVPKTAPTKITGVPAKKTLAKGKSLTLKPKLSPKGAEAKITYKSSNKKVATVSASGKITAKKKGTAVITVTAGKVKTTCKITVK